MSAALPFLLAELAAALAGPQAGGIRVLMGPRGEQTSPPCSGPSLVTLQDALDQARPFLMARPTTATRPDSCFGGGRSGARWPC